MPLFRELLNTAFKKIAFIALVFVILTGSIFWFYMIPRISESLMDQKKLMVHEMSYFLIQILEELEMKEEQGLLNKGQAKEIAIKIIQDFRYGEDHDDYFWANQVSSGVMIAHPLERLLGDNIETYTDPSGYNFGKDMLEIVRRGEEGYISYQWYAKNDESTYVPKISHVMEYEPWGWLIGTGIYVDDVQREVSSLTQRIIAIFGIILLLMIGLLIYIIRVGAKIEQQRNVIQSEFMALIQHLPIGIFRSEIDKNGDDKPPVLWNKAMIDLLELPAYTHFKDKNFRLKNFLKDAKDRENLIKTILDKKAIISKEYKITTFKGKELWIRLNGQLITKNGKKYLDASMEDITQKKEAEKILKRSYDELQKVDLMKNEIISITSHEIRTPLTIIKGFASLLTKDETGSLNKEQKEYVEKISKNTEKLLEMTTNMLDLERLGSGKMRIEKKELDLRDLLQEIYDDFDKRCSTEQKKLTLILPERPLIVFSDPTHLKRIFINLIDNAIKFSRPKDGHIDIIAKKKSESEVEVHVVDNGIGIAEKDLSDIFVKFKQAGNHIERTHGGSGLGLPIVKKLLEQLDGEVFVSSEIGSGSDFCVVLKVK